MSVEVDDYETDDNETITLSVAFQGIIGKEKWTVACWDSDGDNRWSVDFPTREATQPEFDRWR